MGRSGIRNVRVVREERAALAEPEKPKVVVKPSGCEVCGGPLPKSLGKRARTTCSPKCRTAKSRKGK